MGEHDLHRYMTQLTLELDEEYQRIRSRALEDPGTAGDEGEENWANLLRRWLPSTYHVVTKGRLVDYSGHASPQLDVIVLRPWYPPVLRDKKHYLLDGVAAVFECKTTLRGGHLAASAQRCLEVKRMPRSGAETGSPWRELHGGVLYGLLAHSHEWRAPRSTPKENVTESLENALNVADHPRELIDLVCIADLATWHSGTLTMTSQLSGGPEAWAKERERRDLPIEGGVLGIYVAAHGVRGGETQPPPPVGGALAKLYGRLGQEDAQLRTLADYMAMAGIDSPGKFISRTWPLSVFSRAVSDVLTSGSAPREANWGEWRQLFL